VKFLCDQCKAKYQIADDKAAGKTVRMKCRKCGHLIEVRATVEPGAEAASAPAPAAGAPRPPAKPAPPRASPLAGSLASGKSQGKPPERPASALAGAFKSSVQREEESSAPFDMADLSPSDEWYVAINGVPVGPIRVAEVRRKAALGAVTEESLCWQEGLDEWRPVRSFPELALIVREAVASGRSSLPPSQSQSEARPPPAPAQRSGSVRPAASAASSTSAPRAPVPARPAAPAAMAARSNVVPITSRLATAERIEDAPDDLTRPQAEPAVVADPFANMPGPAASMPVAMATQHVAAMSPGAAAILATPEPVAAERKAPPWMAIAMVAAACAFGVTAGIAVFFRPAAAPAPTVAVPGPTAPAFSGVAIAPTAPAATAMDNAAPEPTTTASTTKGPVAMGGRGGGPAPTATTTAAAKGPLDLGGLGTSSIRPTDDPGSNDGPKAPGQCFTSGQVSQVIGLHQPGIRRSCWERNPTTKAAVNVSVSLTIGSDGSAQGVSATADEPSIAMCVQNDVKTWHFPAMGCSQQTSFSFHFVRQ
jgi:predicted Zn finger-like uncharacterized protein